MPELIAPPSLRTRPRVDAPIPVPDHHRSSIICPARAYSEHRKVCTRHEFRGGQPGFSAGREVDRCRSTTEYAIEELLLLLEIAADRVGHQIACAEGLRQLFAIPVDENQALGVVDREGAKKDLIDKRVKGGGRANSECKGKYCCRRKRRASNNRSRRETKVVHEIPEPSTQPDVAHFLSNPHGATEFQRNAPSRLAFWQTRMNQIRHAAVDVPPISERGTVPQIAALFGGPDRMREAVTEMQALLYAS
jgi:hypothetical protein